MRTFLDDNFLLKSEAAGRLYHDYAKAMPILDYHSHLPPQQVAEDSRFDNLGQLWLGGDHYKWRAMRSNGVPEELVTGNRSWREKFQAWAETVPRCAGNPLYHWTHLELRRYFGIDTILDGNTAESVWQAAQARMAEPGFSVRGLLRMQNVQALATTDDPIDSLDWHRRHAAVRAADPAQTVMVPTFRPDKAMAVDQPVVWKAWVEELARASGQGIRSFDDLVVALDLRHSHFHNLGCRLSDHALEVPPESRAGNTGLDAAMASLFAGQALEPQAVHAFRAAILEAVGAMNQRRGWTMQLHIGALRNLNGRMFSRLGPDTGFDAISDAPIARNLASLLDRMDSQSALPKTILYTLNPAANEVLGTIMGCFQDGSVPGKIQFGSAWWFNDQLDGMERQLKALASLGLLSRFAGMLTDSRSFLSFPRHEYFRRLLCNLLGGWVTDGELPADYKLLGQMVRDIAFNNAQRLFGLPGTSPV